MSEPHRVRVHRMKSGFAPAMIRWVASRNPPSSSCMAATCTPMLRSASATWFSVECSGRKLPMYQAVNWRGGGVGFAAAFLAGAFLAAVAVTLESVSHSATRRGGW